MSLQQWQAWIEKDNEVQTDVSVTQKKRKMRGRHVCIKWDMTVMEMTWILRRETRGSNEGKNNGGLLRLQVWSAAGGLEARQSRAEVRSAHPAWWSQPQVVRSPQGWLKLDHSSRRLQLLLQALIFLPPWCSDFNDCASVKVTSLVLQCAKGENWVRKCQHV